jgi:hypothetical protein
MGDDPSNSVTDATGRWFHHVSNAYACDQSVALPQRRLSEPGADWSHPRRPRRSEPADMRVTACA